MDTHFIWMQMLLALMDEAYTGSTIADGGVDSESEDSSAIDAADPFFLEFLKDENDGLPVRFLPCLISCKWTHIIFLLFKLARKFRDMQFFLVFCFLRITIDFLSNSHFLSNDSYSDVAVIFSLHILPFLPLFQICCCSSLIRIS
jgi:hypothetical protein